MNKLLKFKPRNPMIAAALRKGQDATGLCTLRDLVEDMIEQQFKYVENTENTDICELRWQRKNGDMVNVEVRIIGHE